MVSRASVIPGDAILSFTDAGGGEVSITWDDLVAELLMAEVGDHLVMPQTDEPLTPTIAFGTGIDGWYSSAAAVLRMALAGVLRWSWTATTFEAADAAGPQLRNAAASATLPTLNPDKGDVDTGVGTAGADALSLIAGAVEGLRLIEATGILQVPQADVGLTAHVDSGIGDGLILSSYNVYSTVAVAGDAATLPEIFPVNTLVYVKNDAAVNSMDVFPFLGTDLGAGGDTALAVAAGDFVVFIATVADSVWTQLMAGSA